MADDRVLATVLFTDIVDSTRRASEMGDRDWHALLDAHDAVVRVQQRQVSGREVNTSGDSFLAMFDGLQRAIRCAMAIRDAVQALGIEVRAGLHTGECEIRGDDIGGIAVHIGARVSALAAAERGLVSSTLRDLVIGSGLQFDERGAHELKGVPGEWQLFAVACLSARTVAVYSVRRQAVVESAFGGFGFGGVVGAGVAAFGHHGAAVAGGLGGGWFAGPQGGGGCTELREQVQAAGIGGVGVAGWAGPDDGAVG